MAICWTASQGWSPTITITIIQPKIFTCNPRRGIPTKKRKVTSSRDPVVVLGDPSWTLCPWATSWTDLPRHLIPGAEAGVDWTTAWGTWGDSVPQDHPLQGLKVRCFWFTIHYCILFHHDGNWNIDIYFVGTYNWFILQRFASDRGFLSS